MESGTPSVGLLEGALIQCRRVVLSNRTSYSVGPGFEYRPANSYRECSSSWSLYRFSHASDRDRNLKQTTALYSVSFVIRCHPTVVRTYAVEKASLNKHRNSYDFLM
jgi:hypothetical protein